MSDNIVRYFFSGHRSEAKLLATIAEHPSELNASTPYGLTPLKAAIQKGTPGEVSLLLKNGAVLHDHHFSYARRYFVRLEVIAAMNEVLILNVVDQTLANSPVEKETASTPQKRQVQRLRL